MKTFKELSVRKNSVCKYKYLIIDKKIKLWEFLRYDAKVDFEKQIVIWPSDKEYEASPLPTLNDLKSDGRLEIVNLLHEYTIYPKKIWTVNEIIEEFAQHGLKVSKKAILHNYEAWQKDCKSGYRGQETHLFTPCGCNPLSFTASKLSKLTDWQTTYIY